MSTLLELLVNNVEFAKKENTKRYILFFDGNIITGYSGKILYASRKSAMQSLSYSYSRGYKEELEQLKKEGRIICREIDIKDMSLSEEEILQKYINNALKNV